MRCAVCQPCEYFAACGAKEMFMVNDGGASQYRCMTAQPLYCAIERYLEEQGVNTRTLSSYIPDALQELGYSDSHMPVGSCSSPKGELASKLDNVCFVP